MSNKLKSKSSWWERHHNHIYGFISSLGLIATIIFYLYPRTNQNGQKASQTIEEAQQSRYLPLNVGNNWIYKKTVFGRNKVYNWHSIEMDGNIAYVSAPSDNIQPGVYEEIYAVKSQITERGIKRWVIDVGKRTTRDGRYDFGNYVKNILWGRLVSSGDVIEIGEILILNIANAKPIPKEIKETRTLLIEPLGKWNEAECTISIIPQIKTTTTKRRVSIQVPAGDFADCLEIITVSKATDRENNGKLVKTYSYFALGVGLVKEYQENPNEKVTYILELIKYKLHG